LGKVYLFIRVIFLCMAGCGGAEYARDKGIPVVLFPKTNEEPDGLSPSDLVSVLRSGFFSQK
jgi:phosphoribosylglycinamide formyltransferase